jgi:hypothetical protein
MMLVLDPGRQQQEQVQAHDDNGNGGILGW